MVDLRWTGGRSGRGWTTGAGGGGGDGLKGGPRRKRPRLNQRVLGV